MRATKAASSAMATFQTVQSGVQAAGGLRSVLGLGAVGAVGVGLGLELFRAIDTAERYRTEKEVGEAMQEVFEAGQIRRAEVFVATKLWNTNHRPERVKPAFEASLKKLQLDYLDLYLIHTPFAFQPGDEQDPRDANGHVIQVDFDPKV